MMISFRAMISMLIVTAVYLATLVIGPAGVADDTKIDAADGDATHAGAKDLDPPVVLSVRSRMPSLYEVASRVSDDDKKRVDKHRTSQNYPLQLTQDRRWGQAGKLSLIVDSQEACRFLKYEGLRVRLVNRTETRVTFSAIDSYLYLAQEAQDQNGEWKPIERTHPGTGPRDCGVGMHQVFLEPNEFWNITAPRFTGSIKTKLRFRLNKGSGSPDGTTVYSEPFDGSVNPEQLQP